MGDDLTSTRVKGSRDEGGRRVSSRPLVGRVLVVDDMYDDAILLAQLLEPLDATIAVARSAAEALTMVDTQLVDLVVTDLNMPGGSGLDLTRQLRRLRDIPAVIFLTGSTCAAHKITAFELGAAAYLQKPVDVEYLIGLAKEILRVHRARRASGAPARITPQQPRRRPP
jgi:CheY-like chemotaxis protein